MHDTSPSFQCSQLPARSGIGLKVEHRKDIIDQKPDLGFVEIHAENYMGEGGAPHRFLEEMAARYPLSIHGVGLSIGGAGPLDKEHLARLKRLLERYRPASFSEHLAWSTHQEQFLNDLLPLPYTEATLDRVASHVDEVQQTLGRQMLLENPSTYLLFEESTIEETDFLGRIAERTGCGLLFDVNNVMVTCTNHGLDPMAYIDRFPVQFVGEIHLAGHEEIEDDAGQRVLVDTHDRHVSPDVFGLYRHALSRLGPVATLIEWDNDVPPFETLFAEARMADAIMADFAGMEAEAAQ
ncbi:DUF692 family multinuclear iron-containing protein [Notoacmeibacter sp. MSK16QG-6]|uniref:MNIO family bufferin maturase n=1 Tax=Notoacmeibacter sp. MSK16QG-6 TaxID=2957982 RepID=UPI00209ED79E|nr:DUF692 domain-containing protein [Notoacmeibacter sp. MSK16QG-6]MCP1198088.1 DUF692 domain-containing protein [Notoacmeibacter sp. MSK16QG-6]